MGRLGYSPCIYDSFYPCSFGCNKTNCEYYEKEELEEDEEEECEDE